MQRKPVIAHTGNEGAGSVWPSRPMPELLDFDARTRAVEALGQFISLLRFRRTGGKGGRTITFRIPAANIHDGMPDNVEHIRFPSIVFQPQRGGYTAGIGPAEIIDETLDVFGAGTALMNLAEYHEIIRLEVWASNKAIRRAIVGALETVIPSYDNSWALTLRLSDHYNLTATYALVDRENVDDADAARNRRRGHLYIELTTCMVRLVNVNTMRPLVSVEVSDDC